MTEIRDLVAIAEVHDEQSAMEKLIAQLTPDERQFWMETAPAVLNPQGLQDLGIASWCMGSGCRSKLN